MFQILFLMLSISQFCMLLGELSVYKYVNFVVFPGQFVYLIQKGIICCCFFGGKNVYNEVLITALYVIQ